MIISDQPPPSQSYKVEIYEEVEFEPDELASHMHYLAAKNKPSEHEVNFINFAKHKVKDHLVREAKSREQST